ncbi:predicted protein [Uncinocarpus reesii 1704]|uniref:Uncharacterized protein n=1 Tax=Uncinocarpus reesii (strain UAMH 1704) TaxID=336963 RepID=C4JJ05_UNCRE|nr:uncharacterized protein UREG_01612 [Uncinocarpus reesii 1704]EEP76763.1 predicted protein [Uncinocarpus reesii 1704]
MRPVVFLPFAFCALIQAPVVLSSREVSDSGKGKVMWACPASKSTKAAVEDSKQMMTAQAPGNAASDVKAIVSNGATPVHLPRKTAALFTRIASRKWYNAASAATLSPMANITAKSLPKSVASSPAWARSGVCELPPPDWIIIVSTVGLKELFGSKEALIAVLETADGCMDFYLWLIKHKQLE